MAMQYPLIFSHGEDGYRPDIKHKDAETTTRKNRTFVTMREYYAFRFQERRKWGKLIDGIAILFGRLWKQFLVDAFTCVEEMRLQYVRSNQKDIRKYSLRGLIDAVAAGATTAALLGQRIILPPSFPGGFRFLFQNYQDALAICRWPGPPDLFITFTCNPQWPEIKEFLAAIPGQRPEDRPDIVSRVFKIKLDELIKDITKRAFFGRILAVVYTVEFQKRGLPHAHICLFLHPPDKYPEPEDINKIISAELPDKEQDPVGYDAVMQFMIHGPCGDLNSQSPCMVDGKCSKYYPRKFCKQTSVSEDGYPEYRRRNDGRTGEKNDHTVDNRFVVPHNIDLLVKYQAHLNVEWCNKNRSIKYLFKYMSKGHDMNLASIKEIGGETDDGEQSQKPDDEIETFLRCRYLSASEASWQHEQQVVFEDNEQPEEVLERVGEAKTTLTEWMATNKKHADARHLTYSEFPSEWVWVSKEKIWKRREKGMQIGRIYYAPPNSGELYYLRLLLNIVQGATCYADIMTFNNVVHPTFKAACNARGLLDGDDEWHLALDEAARWSTARQIRELFTTILLFCEVSDPKKLWETHWEKLYDDILPRQRRMGIGDLSLSTEQIKNYALHELEVLLNRSGRSLRQFADFPMPDSVLMHRTTNRLLLEEQEYDEEALGVEADRLEADLNPEQRTVYDTVIEVVHLKKGGVFFVYGSGGTGKTYLWKTLISRLRSQSQIVLAVASSGIAALLLIAGRTAHSRFAIPIILNDSTSCKIEQGSDLAHLIRSASLIIWDEAPMVHRHAFEAVDRAFRDIMQVDDPMAMGKVFGGKTIVLGGDFRQILPVVPQKGRLEIVDASISKSQQIWPHCVVLKLQKNMRLGHGLNDEDTAELALFSQWVLDMGDGKLEATAKEGEDEKTWITIPKDILMPYFTDPIASIVKEVYPELLANYTDATYLQGRAILTPKNETAEEVNNYMLRLIPGTK